MSSESLIVKGAKVHNLKNISCEIPHNSLTVITGVSGSGKSSLAFDTIYAEGQRRYIESLSAYARQFLERIEKPDVEEIEGIAPAIAIRQKNAVRNPRSTVATVTEVYDYLRLLFARVGRTICLQCHQEVKKDEMGDVAQGLLSLPAGTRIYVLFPFSAYRKAKESRHLAVKTKTRKKKPALAEDALREVLMDLRREGFHRLFQERRIHDLSSPESLLDLDFTRDLFVLVDRLEINSRMRQRLVDSLETCCREGDGHVTVEIVSLPEPGEVEQNPILSEKWPSALGQKLTLDVGTRFSFSDKFECQRCHIEYTNPEPRLFSFNNPFGACPRCQGFGNTVDFDMNLVVPDPEKSLQQGAIEPWTKPRYRTLSADFKRFATRQAIPVNVPYRSLSTDQKELIYKGDDQFIGIRRFFDRLELKKYKLYIRVFLSRYRGYTLCSDCEGSRLRPEARAIKIAGKDITAISTMTVEQANSFFDSLELSPYESSVGEKILEEIQLRLKFLLDVGLEYLGLDRLASSLSGGESQRIQLATSLGSALVGVLYVLDEPSIGLHPRDNSRLINILKNLRDSGNTVLVVEHEAQMMKAADRILDLGPGAGEQGGQVVFAGNYRELLASTHSLTGKYLKNELRIPLPSARLSTNGRWFKIYGASQHNLKSLDVAIPLGVMTCITGVSGSGKSTLVHEVIFSAMKARRGEFAEKGNFRAIEGDQWISDVVLVDQSPIGRTPRSNPVTYTKAYDAIRDLFASTIEAQNRSYAAGHFSFNIPGGRCEACEGDGTVTVQMQFLADVELVCEECKGMRFKPGILEVRYKGKNIYDVLQMTIREAISFFTSVPRITNRLKFLQEVGLGYLRLGQPASTLSGGEAQRVKLASYLAKQVKQSTLYIFDEPTTGLHFDDIHKLLITFRKLIRTGATLLVIEHNLDVIKTADWIIDLGPEGGDKGGRLVACGTPEEIAQTDGSYTGYYLKSVLSAQGNPPAVTNSSN